MNEFCYNKTDGYYPDPDDPASYYQCYNCGNGDEHALTVHNTCATSLIWSEYYQTCAYPAEFCNGREDGTYPDPEDCQMYYICYDDGNGENHLSCSGTDKFHAECLYCVADNKFNCGDDEFCETKSPGTYADPLDPSRYYSCLECSSENTYVYTAFKECPSGGPWLDDDNEYYCNETFTALSPLLRAIQMEHSQYNVNDTAMYASDGDVVTLVEGTEELFTCEVSGTVVANITWEFDGEVIPDTTTDNFEYYGVMYTSSAVIANPSEEGFVNKTLYCFATYEDEEISLAIDFDILCK